MTMNKIIVVGNLGRDPEMRYTPSGQAVTSFSVATNHRYTTGEGEQRDETEWFSVSVFGRQAEACNQYLSKGQKVYVDGRLKSRTFQGRDGETRVALDIIAQQVRFLDRAAAADALPADVLAADMAPPSGEGVEAEDLPF